MVVVAVAVGTGVYLLLAKKAATNNPPVEGNHPRPVQKNESIFIGSHESGFEGYFSRVIYSLRYDATQLDIASLSTNGAEMKEKETGKTHTIKFFYNDGAGFKDSRELWEAHSYCKSCTEIPLNLSIKGSKDAIAFENEKEEWIIFSKSGIPVAEFTIIEIQKPLSASAKSSIESLWLHVEDSARPDKTAVKAYFLNNNTCALAWCEDPVAVARLIEKTPKVATMALEELLKGPTENERNDGYISVLPLGSKLNSLVIINGEAKADFNAITESGGGSSSMRARTEQIRQTLLQFPSVKTVKLSIDGRTEDIFQP